MGITTRSTRSRAPAATSSRSPQRRSAWLCRVGNKPRTTAPEGPRRYFEQIASTEKRLVVYPDCLHEPHNELLRDRVVRDVTRWVEQVLERQTTESVREGM